MSSWRSRSKIYLRVAQTTVGDLGFAVRSVGISLGPGLVDFVAGPSLSADPPDLAAKQLMNEQAELKIFLPGEFLKLKFTMRMANEARIRVCAAPVAARRQVRGDAESLSSFAMSLQSI